MIARSDALQTEVWTCSRRNQGSIEPYLGFLKVCRLPLERTSNPGCGFNRAFSLRRQITIVHGRNPAAIRTGEIRATSNRLTTRSSNEGNEYLDCLTWVGQEEGKRRAYRCANLRR